MKQKILLLPILLLLFVSVVSAQEPSSSVFFRNQGGSRQWLTYQDNHRALYKIITDEAFRLLDEREEKVSRFSTREDWENHQKEMKSVLCHSLEKFSKTPLNAVTTGTLERETFTVEKVRFESHPGFYVTAGLFLPKKRQNPAPAVIYACGHTELGFRSDTYQHVILNLVDKGFIVLAFDPLGQGERLQYLDAATGKSKAGGPTKEHSFAGVQTLLTGASLTDYFIWDGIRVLDYLETRPEVDMQRIGMTGRSGGGTQTAQVAACDDRIYATAPECYITSFRRLLQSIGPQDAEQNPYNAIAGGFDHADFIHVRAPKPTLMVTTTHDFFSIQGARETFAEAQKSYAALGKPKNIQMCEDFGVHESTQKNREELYAFFQKHLNNPGENKDIETTPFTLEELWITPTGQLATSYECETVFTLNQKYFSKKSISAGELKEKALQTAGIQPDRKLTAAVYTGKFQKENADVKKYFLENDKKDYALPVYVIEGNKNSSKNLVVWFHQDGKSAIFKTSQFQEILSRGSTIVAADLPGIDELNDPDFTGDGVIAKIPFNYTFGANLAGKSIPGIQAEAIDLLSQFLQSDPYFMNRKPEAIVQGNAASALLHFAMLNNPFEKITFWDFPGKVMELVKTEFYNPETAFSAVPGSLPFYDLSDLTDYLKISGTEIEIHLKK